MLKADIFLTITLDYVKGKVDKKDSGYNFSCIAVDMTYFPPGVEYCGAKMMAIELVRSLSRLLPFCRFVLLTSKRSHDEFSFLDSMNVRHLCVSNFEPQPRFFFSGLQKIYVRIHLPAWLTRILPHPLMARLNAYNLSRVIGTGSMTGSIKKLQADLLFCPFTVPFFHDPAVPIVSIIYDLQYHYYPQFFDREEYYRRERTFKEVCRLSNHLVCTSEYVRGTILENSDLQAEQVHTIPIRLSNILKKPEPPAISTLLQKYGLKENGFLLYPANFWPHKNHAMLFTAFGMYRSRHPMSPLHLVCSGSLDAKTEALKEAVVRMGMGKDIIFPGYLSDEEFAALLASCQALIFPSLYEGFGMPVLEAMTLTKPVLCSSVTSLPELAGDAALYFDPRKPEEILSAIERIAVDPHLRQQLTERAASRAAFFRDTESMAREYVRIFDEVVNGGRRYSTNLHGLYPDRWTQERVVITYGAGSERRQMQMTFEVPSFYPYEWTSVKISEEGTRSKVYRIMRGKSVTISHRLAGKGGGIELLFQPTFKPKELGMNNDERWLGCICEECLIIDGPNIVTLLEKAQLQ